MKKFLFVFIAFFVFACNESPSSNEIEKVDETTIPENHGDLETYAKRHVTVKLGIPSTEKFDLKIYKENLDGDDKEDAIITVNRKEFAINEAAQSPNPAKRAEIGFMGNYNYIFYYDGGLDLISPPIAIPSSPLLPLKVRFESILSGDYKDILIDFRIRNASYMDVYNVKEHTPRRIFQWKNFDGMGTQNYEANSFRFVTSTLGTKDIEVVQSSLGNVPKDADLNTFEPELIPGKNVLYRFFYDHKEGKFMTLKKP